MKRRLFTSIAAVLSMGGASLLTTPTAFAASYNRNAAVAYADTYATSPNSANWPVYSDDCTNFASQVLLAGGMPMYVNYNTHTGAPETTTNDSYWFYQSGAYSYSWQVSWDLWNYLLTYSGRGSHVGTYNGNIGNNQYNTLSGGDLIGYNWGDSTGKQHPGQPTHWSVEAGYGTDPSSGWTGDYVDEHTSNRYHAYWTLQPYNSYASSTQVYTVSITY